MQGGGYRRTFTGFVQEARSSAVGFRMVPTLPGSGVASSWR